MIRKLLALFLVILYPSVALAETFGHNGYNDPTASVLLGILVILVATRIAGRIAEGFGQSSVFGELTVGIVLGNLYLVGIDQLEFLKINYTQLGLIDLKNLQHCAGFSINVMSRIGVVLLLFIVGLEVSFEKMRRVALSALFVGIIGVVAPMMLGWTASSFLLPGQPWPVYMFIGATLSATSIGITARVLDDLGKTSAKESEIILGASVIDDVLGLLILAVVSGMLVSMSPGAEAPGLPWRQFGIIILKAFVFLGSALIFGQMASRWFLKAADFLHGQDLLLISGLTFCFLMAYLANLAGLAVIVGAFAAGLFLDKCAYECYAERHHELRLKTRLQPLRDLFVPIFFVMVGIQVNLKDLLSLPVLTIVFILVFVAIIGKMLSALGIWDSHVNRLSVGAGMIPRGEVGLIFASMGTQLKIQGVPIINAEVYTILILVILATTLVTPPLLKWTFNLEKERSNSWR